MARTSFEATGQSAVVRGQFTRYYADFTTGTGVGTVQLEIQTEEGNWIPADEAVTADMDVVKVAEPGRVSKFRWNCTAFTSGVIACDLE